MKTDDSDTMTAAALRDLDPARTTVLTAEERERADATFSRIVATPSHDRVAVKDGRPRRRRRRLLVSAGMAGATGVAVVPALLLGGGSAFASWTPEPEPLRGAAVSAAAATCRASLEVPDRGERAVVAERRGGWTYVLIAGRTSEGFCLMPDDLIGRRGAAKERERGFFGGYTTDPAEAPVLPRDGIDETESMVGSVPTPGPWLLGDDEGWFTSVQGHVGSDVTGVTVHTPGGTDVEASVANGRYAAWWPSEQPSSENPEAMGAPTYTVTLADGGTRRVTS